MYLEAHFVAPWCSDYDYCSNSLSKIWNQVLRRLKPYSRRVGDLQWWEPLKIVPAESKNKRLSSVNPLHKTWSFSWRVSSVNVTKNQLVRKSYTIGSDYTNTNKFITVINRINFNSTIVILLVLILLLFNKLLVWNIFKMLFS